MPETQTIGKVDCRVNIGNITEQEAATMLVPVHQTHPGKGGIFAAALAAGAIAGCEMMHNWHEVSPEFMRPGEVLTVPSGGGKTNFLSLVASVCEGATGRENNFATVVLSVQSVLEDMLDKGITSVSVPLMGTGQVGWLDAEQSSRAMLTGIQRFTKDHPNAPLEVVFCAQDEAKAAILNETMNQPQSYTDIASDVILNERGKVNPPAFNALTHRAGGPLAQRLGGMSKFAGNMVTGWGSKL